MTPEQTAAAEAQLAMREALRQLGELVVAPLARIDADSRAGYYHLHTKVASIGQRLGREVWPQLDQLATIHKDVSDQIARYEQRRLNLLAVPLQRVQQRVGGDILGGISQLG